MCPSNIVAQYKLVAAFSINYKVNIKYMELLKQITRAVKV